MPKNPWQHPNRLFALQWLFKLPYKDYYKVSINTRNQMLGVGDAYRDDLLKHGTLEQLQKALNYSRELDSRLMAEHGGVNSLGQRVIYPQRYGHPLGYTGFRARLLGYTPISGGGYSAYPWQRKLETRIKELTPEPVTQTSPGITGGINPVTRYKHISSTNNPDKGSWFSRAFSQLGDSALEVWFDSADKVGKFLKLSPTGKISKYRN